MDRWTTYDCYGTLVDWNAGIRGQLERLVGGEGERLLARYHELEPQLQEREPSLPYREVMAAVLAEIAAEEGATVPDEERDALGRSLPGWPVFPEVPGALAELRERGWKLAILSNSDPDLIAASMESIGVPFDLAITASEIGSYKPAHCHWEEFWSRTGAPREGHVHVAQSHFHDIVPANELGLRSVWINRLGESGDPAPTRELPDLNGLADTVDELVRV
jgi:2-haloacid dehalogenase